MFSGTYTKAVLMVVIAIALSILVLNPIPAFAQASVGDYASLSPEQKFYFVSGYLDGFALAASMPPDRAASLHKCFADFGTIKVALAYEKWIVKNPAMAQKPELTARTGLFIALAEACGWTQR